MCSLGAAIQLLREGGRAFSAQADALEKALDAKVAWVSRFKPNMPGAAGFRPGG
jgi:hypothetical protein